MERISGLSFSRIQVHLWRLQVRFPTGQSYGNSAELLLSDPLEGGREGEGRERKERERGRGRGRGGEREGEGEGGGGRGGERGGEWETVLVCVCAPVCE